MWKTAAVVIMYTVDTVEKRSMIYNRQEVLLEVVFSLQATSEAGNSSKTIL